MNNTSHIKECPDCASPNIVHSQDRDQIICRDCGLIYEPLTPVVEEPAKKAKKPAKKAPTKKKKK
ncbi:hypothetical protein J4219_08815 [Candidatus Woesearchaeota archaeon]|nr:hypothetical protein [Candidatus Woesearchaeota archaeon]